MPRGFDVQLADPLDGEMVKFDGCCEANPNCLHDGDMLEAKGPGYDGFMTSRTDWQWWYRGLKNIQAQMITQDRAAGTHGRIVEWHFADERPAAYFRGFVRDGRLSHTTVIVTPAHVR